MSNHHFRVDHRFDILAETPPNAAGHMHLTLTDGRTHVTLMCQEPADAQRLEAAIRTWREREG